MTLMKKLVKTVFSVEKGGSGFVIVVFSCGFMQWGFTVKGKSYEG